MPTIALERLDLDQVIQGWETAKAGRGVAGGPLQIAGRRFEHGVGTHSVSSMDILLDGRAQGFRAIVGVDDAVGAQGLGAVRFRLLVDGRTVADSGVRRGGQEGVVLEADLRGARCLRLQVDAPDDITHHGHADWADAQITYEGAEPILTAPDRGEPLAPVAAPDPAPRFIVPPHIGARPGRPVHQLLPLLGDPATEWSCDGLPGDLRLDPRSGLISGRAPSAGSWSVPVRARNAAGEARTTVRIRVDNQALAPTPPMGWTSWNAYGAAVTQADVAANHRAIVDLGLHRYGYRTINTDDGWQGGRRADSAIPWALQPNADFPDIAAMVADIHADGLQAGIYSVACLYSPQGLMGGSGEHPDGTSDMPFQHGHKRPIGPHRFFTEDLHQWAAWGFDMVKIDNCPPPWVVREFVAAQATADRDIIIALSARMPVADLGEHRGLAQQWRTTGDLIDTWPSVRNKLWSQLAYLGQGGPGGWNDCDMLVIGDVGPGWNGRRRPSRLTWREQALHIGMWSFLASPLLIGCDCTRMDATTRDLLIRPGLIALNQDPLGAAALPIALDPERGMMQWIRPLADGDLAVALVNTGEEDLALDLDLRSLGLAPAVRISDCWTGQTVDHDRGRVGVVLAPHDHRIWRCHHDQLPG